jgi:predicted anti-sigma-YlaC factor YlaD
MNCPECQDLLQRKLDGETVGGEALEFHLSQCATCR